MPRGSALCPPRGEPGSLPAARAHGSGGRASACFHPHAWYANSTPVCSEEARGRKGRKKHPHSRFLSLRLRLVLRLFSYRLDSIRCPPQRRPLTGAPWPRAVPISLLLEHQRSIMAFNVFPKLLGWKGCIAVEFIKLLVSPNISIFFCDSPIYIFQPSLYWGAFYFLIWGMSFCVNNVTYTYNVHVFSKFFPFDALIIDPSGIHVGASRGAGLHFVSSNTLS